MVEQLRILSYGLSLSEQEALVGVLSQDGGEVILDSIEDFNDLLIVVKKNSSHLIFTTHQAFEHPPEHFYSLLESGNLPVPLLILAQPDAAIQFPTAAGALIEVVWWKDLAVLSRLVPVLLKANEFRTRNAHIQDDLENLHAQFQRLVTPWDDAFISIDDHQTIVWVSPGAEKMFGYTAEELIGTPADRLTPKRFLETHHEYINRMLKSPESVTPKEKPQRVWGLRKNQAEFPGEAFIAKSIRNHKTILTIRLHDLSEQLHLEEQFLQAQKMEVVGRLASGVAHDFNNLLTVILGHSNLLLRWSGLDTTAYRSLKEITKAAERASELTRQLLLFSRKQEQELKIIHLNTVLTDINKMLQRIIGEDIELVYDLDPTIQAIKADPRHIEQIVLNLCINARDAMPQGGTIHISTHLYQSDFVPIGSYASLLPGSYIALKIQDTGTGIRPELLDRIFEPFFTTKDPEKGTGLGLSTVYGLVRQSEGQITVESELGKGTTFSVFLPCNEETLDLIPAEPILTTTAQGTETILVVEDDKMVSEYLKQVLEMSGFQVLVAQNGMEAHKICMHTLKPLHLLMTDVVMPKMNGIELAKMVSRFHPNMKILIMSGYQDQVQDTRTLHPSWAFIRKPFRVEELLKKIRDLLDAD
ncbi:MAG TPA: ATP-binding protein [Acidobacteriota bacterium]|nr:ATP-binding protein [Acidobacteriota bacterium]HNG94601.1 ATP-binding protein [Acidobacteriota bacterium]